MEMRFLCINHNAEASLYVITRPFTNPNVCLFSIERLLMLAQELDDGSRLNIFQTVIIMTQEPKGAIRLIFPG